MPGPPVSRGNRAVWRLLLLFTVAGAAAGLYHLWPKTTIAVRAARAEVGTVRDVVSSSVAGEVTPELHATVRAEIGGTVRSLRNKTGDRVEKGQVVIQLDQADLAARLSQAQAAASAARGQLMQAEARLSTLKRQADRARTLLTRGAGTAQVSEDADAAVKESTQALLATRGQAQQAEAAEQVARIAREHADIVAPFAGQLTEILPNQGDDVLPGAEMFQIIDDSRLHVDATIDEADAAKVRPGQEAVFDLDALPDHPVKGRVSRVDPAVKRDLKGARTLGVEVEVLDVDASRQAGLKPGMSANVEIVVAEKHDVLYLPTNVVIGRGVTRSVFLLIPDGKYYRAKKTEVKIGLSNWDRSEVQSGLAAGARVVASLNTKGLDDGVLCSLQADRRAPSP
jgi:HlyD family secretion protein